jgi:hypothetical protein
MPREAAAEERQAEVEAEERQASALAPLPLTLVHKVFVSLPADCKARASCVCRAWRAALAAPALWARLDLSGDSGVPDALNGDALLTGAAARAHGQLFRLDVSGRENTTHGISQRALLAVLRANAASLRELRVDELPAAENGALEALARAAPRLASLEAEAICDCETAARLLRGAPPLAALRLRALTLVVSQDFIAVPAAAPRRHDALLAPVAAALADPALQPALAALHVQGAELHLPEVLGPLADAAATRGLRSLTLFNCTPPAAAPLARLLAGGALASLTCESVVPPAPLLAAADADAVAHALRGSTTLTCLHLHAARLCRRRRRAAGRAGGPPQPARAGAGLGAPRGSRRAGRRAGCARGRGRARAAAPARLVLPPERRRPGADRGRAAAQPPPARAGHKPQRHERRVCRGCAAAGGARQRLAAAAGVQPPPGFGARAAAGGAPRAARLSRGGGGARGCRPVV